MNNDSVDLLQVVCSVNLHHYDSEKMFSIIFRTKFEK